MSTETPSPGAFARLRSLWASSHAPDVRAARLVLDVAAVGLIVAGLGLAWDGSWHFTRPFEGFWSSPPSSSGWGWQWKSRFSDCRAQPEVLKSFLPRVS